MQQVLWCQLKDRMRVPCRRPDFIEPEQLLVDQGDRPERMRHGRHATDGVPGLSLHKRGVGSAQTPTGGTHQRLHFGFVHTAVARSNDQDRNLVGVAFENNALGDLPERPPIGKTAPAAQAT